MFSETKDNGNDHKDSNIVTIIIIVNIIEIPTSEVVFFFNMPEACKGVTLFAIKLRKELNFSSAVKS